MELLNPVDQPKFVDELPNPLAPSYIYQPVVPGHYEIWITQFSTELGIIDPKSRQPLLTTVWGYGTPTQPPTYPGRTFVVKRNHPIYVRYLNKLICDGVPLPHLLTIDTTIHNILHIQRVEFHW